MIFSYLGLALMMSSVEKRKSKSHSFLDLIQKGIPFFPKLNFQILIYAPTLPPMPTVPLVLNNTCLPVIPALAETLA